MDGVTIALFVIIGGQYVVNLMLSSRLRRLDQRITRLERGW